LLELLLQLGSSLLEGGAIALAKEQGKLNKDLFLLGGTFAITLCMMYSNVRAAAVGVCLSCLSVLTRCGAASSDWCGRLGAAAYGLKGVPGDEENAPNKEGEPRIRSVALEDERETLY